MTLPHQAEKLEEFTGTSTTRLRCEKSKFVWLKNKLTAGVGLFPALGHRTGMPGGAAGPS
uniref:Uncharacterized protein n=1 Tax=Setaria italica TaxID=4555 RepID=K3ZFR7_SETIT